VKSIWEYYATWFHFDRTTELYTVPANAVYAEVVEAAGSDALVAKARSHLDAGRPVHALHLIEIVLDPDRNDRAALEVRRDALQLLLEQAKNGIRNSYEMDWLKYRLRDTEAKLGTSPVG
jgi:alkyl sulfatase BDS1-like metallo-beta-lactamase superfamily hydrolase